jgi:hypothetical protein
MGQEPSFMSNETIARMSQLQVYGIDRILGREMFFAGRVHEAAAANGVRKLPSLQHDGAGGGLGFADPMYELAFGCIPVPMQYPEGADRRQFNCRKRSGRASVTSSEQSRRRQIWSLPSPIIPKKPFVINWEPSHLRRLLLQRLQRSSHDFRPRRRRPEALVDGQRLWDHAGFFDPARVGLAALVADEAPWRGCSPWRGPRSMMPWWVHR